MKISGHFQNVSFCIAQKKAISIWNRRGTVNDKYEFFGHFKIVIKQVVTYFMGFINEM